MPSAQNRPTQRFARGNADAHEALAGQAGDREGFDYSPFTQLEVAGS